jgi:hypothetical protein
MVAVDRDFIAAVETHRPASGLRHVILQKSESKSLVFSMLAEVSEGMQGVLGLFGKHDQKYRISPNRLDREWGLKKFHLG